MTRLRLTGALALVILLLAACTPMPVTEQPATQTSAQQPATATEAPAEPTAAPVTKAEITASPAEPAARPATEAQVVNIFWQWSDLVETMPASQSVVPDPQNYTLTFLPDGTVSIKADCNMVGGTYTLDGGLLAIQLGPSTMAFCGEGSLDQQYLGLLGQADAASIAGERLFLHLAGDAGQAGFNGGGAIQASSTTGPGTTSGLRSAAGMIQPQQVGIDTQGLPYSWQANLVPATPYDASQPPGPMGLPQHIEINFGVTDPSDRQPGDPVMYIIPVDGYEQMWDSAGNPYVAKMITGVYSWTVALQSPPPTSGLPALPAEQIAGANDLAVQIGRAQAGADSASKSGYRFVGRWAQDANPVTAESRLWYTYQGFTNDGQYLVSFWYPVTTAKLPKQADMTAAEMDKFNSDPQAYIKAQAEMLNALAPSDWQPDLAELDALVGSLHIDGMTATGLQSPVWQWTGTSWYEQTESGYVLKQNPIADPAQYEVVYTPDGALQVKADCNRASGAYTYDGGMVGSVRVRMGPSTMAECGPESRSQELINSLMAAQDYRVQPGGEQLQLNMPAGGPVLNFQRKR